jgi:integrase
VNADVLDAEQAKKAANEAKPVRQIDRCVFTTYSQCLLLAGARREEVVTLKWDDVDFQWNSIKLNDKVKDFRMVPLTPCVTHLPARCIGRRRPDMAAHAGQL